MKEATGELNLTVIVVLLIAILSTFFFSFIWPRIKSGFRHNTRCDDAICVCPPEYMVDGKCTYKGTTVECYFKDDTSKKITCAWKG